jgi:Domain of unknown function (DUF4386)
MTRSTNARLAGFGYLSYIVVGILNEVLMYQATSVDGIAAKLARIAEYSTDVRLAIILKLGECFSVFVLAVALYGITRDEDQELAMLALLCRVAEGVFIATLIPNSQGLLWLASVRTGVSAPDVAVTNALAAFVRAPGAPVGAIFFAVGSTIFSCLLLRGRMIPAWLGWWGVLSSAVLIISAPLQIAGFLTGPLAGYQVVPVIGLPALVFAPVFALWLLIKGVATPSRREMS